MAAMLAFIVCAIAAAMATADAAIAATGTIPRPVTPPVIPVIVVIPVIPVIAIVMIIIVMIVVTVMVPIIVLRVLRTSAGFTRTAADLGNVQGQPPSRAAIERGRIHAGGRRGCCGGQGTIGPEPVFQARSPPVFLAAAGDDGAGGARGNGAETGNQEQTTQGDAAGRQGLGADGHETCRLGAGKKALHDNDPLYQLGTGLPLRATFMGLATRRPRSFIFGCQ